MKRHFVVWAAVCWSVITLMTGCISSGKAPLEVLRYESSPRHTNLIVFMRGMGGTWGCMIDAHECFEKEGFVEALRARHLPYDMVAPSTHFGYYKDRTLWKRLKTDVIEPAKTQGYENIWLVGVSMGGLGSLLYLKENPEDIDGVLIMGPFLGDRDGIIREIRKAGGVRNWEPGPYDEYEDWQRMLWHFLKEYEQTDQRRAPLFLGVGTDDPYYDCQKLLIDYLPSERVLEIDGGHLLSTFKKIWLLFLDQQMLPE
jgi:pimeloyl-ACP methyl ester carboxylesterase